MVELSREELERFMSKADFDFSTTGGWREFLDERSQVHGGAGRDADGIHMRDLKNYSVGAATIITTGQPVPVTLTVRTQGSGLALPSGNVYVFHPDAAWNYKVTTFYIGRSANGGPASSLQQFRLMAGGPGKPSPYSDEQWGSIYYLVKKADGIPGQGVASAAGKQVLQQFLRETTRFMTWGRKLTTMGGAGYIVSVQVGSLPPEENHFLDQVLISPELARRMREQAAGMLQSISGK